VTASIFAAAGASAVAVNVLQVPDPSIYVLLAAGVAALVMLRRRSS
jgi:PEP-CTERM motif